MKDIANLPVKKRVELFQATAAQKGVTDILIEKDFWVCYVLMTIFENLPLKDWLIFKGGTTLSKVYGLIDRFSEDIDLILDWELLGIRDGDAWQERSATQQDKFNESVDELGRDFIVKEIVPQLGNILATETNGQINVTVDQTDGHVVFVEYPAAFPSGYLLPKIKLEIGPRASKIPHEDAEIKPYAAEEYPSVFKKPFCRVKTITSVRTFWEKLQQFPRSSERCHSGTFLAGILAEFVARFPLKACGNDSFGDFKACFQRKRELLEKLTILHQIAFQDDTKVILARYSRHYYDVFKMVNSTIKQRAFADSALLADVVAFKSRFYRNPKARYDLAKPGTLKIIPSSVKVAQLAKDYGNMREMIFGDIPDFSQIVNTLTAFENDFNQLTKD